MRRVIARTIDMSIFNDAQCAVASPHEVTGMFECVKSPNTSGMTLKGVILSVLSQQLYVPPPTASVVLNVSMYC